jgi:hypothetical protein
MSEERMYSPSDIARLTNIPLGEVRRLIKSGDVAANRQHGHTRVGQRQLDVLLAGQPGQPGQPDQPDQPDQSSVVSAARPAKA